MRLNIEFYEVSKCLRGLVHQYDNDTTPPIVDRQKLSFGNGAAPHSWTAADNFRPRRHTEFNNATVS